MDNKVLTALNLCYNLFRFRLRTRKEIEKYLVKKIPKYHFNQKEIDETVKELESEGLIDDKKFIAWFVESRIANKQKSQWVLKRELINHGIEKDLIDNYFAENLLDEENLAYEALKRRWHRWQSLHPQIRFKKTAGFLLRRGFNFTLIKKTIAKFEEKS